MNKKILTAICGIMLLVGLTGCGTSQSNHSSHKSSKDTSMKNMDMSDQEPLTKGFQDELKGFTTIEQAVKKGDFKAAMTVANHLHDEFHAIVLPPLKAKKGETYAENIHGKYDELQDAISSKNPSKITNSIKVNRDNLYTAAKVLGVSLK